LREEALAGKITEKIFVGQYHFGGGMGIRNGWGLWADSDLAKHFKALGVWHPDDMSGIIFASVYRKVTGRNRDLEGQIKYYQDNWAKTLEKGVCLFTGGKCLAPELDDGSHGVNGGCGEGTCQIWRERVIK
jgi:hypothetical protein